MPKKIDEQMYILSTSRAYLTYIGVMGPIVHPLKVSKSAVVKTIMSGAEVYEFIPKTKKTLKLTLGNINNPDRYEELKTEEEVAQRIIAPIEKPGVPVKTADPIKAPDGTPIENLESNEVTPPNKEPIEDNSDAEVATEFTMPEFIIDDGKVNESNIMWSSYTKSQRREIRAKINEINNNQNK